MTTQPRRCWINQPSTLQALHAYHGYNVLALPYTDSSHAVYFVVGDITSMVVPSNVLAEGWNNSTKPLDLAKRLRDLAAGARSKASLIASKSPTSVYIDPANLLRALAQEAEDGLPPDPYAGLDTLTALKVLRRRLVAIDARMNDPHGDGSGTDARAPTGDDYNHLFNLMEDGLRTLMRRLNPEDLEL